MKSAAAISLSIAVASLALLCPGFAQTSSLENSSTSKSVTTVAAQHEAMLMVPARAALLTSLDAKKIQSGQQFRATLTKTIHLKNGPELLRGTVLMGTVTTDKMQAHGTSMLALRFTKAELKGGKVVPIKAIIVGVFPSTDGSFGDFVGDASNIWNDNTLQVDQIDAISGVDLHSKIASRNSGVFVSTKKDDVKLSSGSQLTLAIAAQSSDRQNKNGMSGGA